MASSDDPHADQPLRTAGPPLSEATAALILIHGRGASADSILALADEFDVSGVAFLAPQAAGHTWYPHSFMAPIAQNEPGRTSGLRRIGVLLQRAEAAGLPTERVALLGFSQGACLVTEYAAHHPRRYGGVFGLSGGLIGPAGMTFDVEGDLQGTPVFLGCSDRDPHIPLQRVRETAEAFRQLGAEVTERIYEGMGHTVNRDEIDVVQRHLAALTAGPQAAL